MTPGWEGGTSDEMDQEEQSALELIWALRTGPPMPEGAPWDRPHGAGADDLGHDLGHDLDHDLDHDLGHPVGQLEHELRERRRQLVELLSRHLGEGALAIPAILARLSPEERSRLEGLLEGRTIAEVLGTADLFRVDLE